MDIEWHDRLRGKLPVRTDAGARFGRTVGWATTLADATAHRFPTFLPDGRLLYLSMPSKMIWLASAEAGTSVPLVRSDSQALYAAGWLLFTRQGTLLAQRFDASLSALSGEPIPIARNVLTDPSGGAAFSASPDGAIAYRTDPHNGMTQFKWIDRNGRPLEDVGAPGHYRNPALSPDGTRIAVEVTNAQNGTQDVWLINADSGEASPFASDAANEAYPVWSPDGQSILFASERGDHRVIRFLQKRVDGSSDEVVEWTSEVSVVPYGWAPNGDILVLSKSSRLAGLFFKPERMARALDGESGPIQAQGQVSPNGQWIAYNDYTKHPLRCTCSAFPRPAIAEGKSQRMAVDTYAGGGMEKNWCTPAGWEARFDDGEPNFNRPRGRAGSAPLRRQHVERTCLRPGIQGAIRHRT